MEVEVTSFLGSLTANLKKFDIDAHSQTLLTAGRDWIETFQKQLSAGYWIEASLDRQLSILYVLNAYLKEAFRKRDDVDVWLTTIDMMLSNLHIKDSFHEKEVKHVLKLVTIWGNKEKDPKGKAQSSKRRLSIFPTEHCEKWLAAITDRALKCGIRLNSTTNEAAVMNTDQIALPRPGVEVNVTTKSIQSSSSVNKFPIASVANKHPAYPASTLSVPIIPALPTHSTSSTSLPSTNDTNHKFIQAVCKFQMQVFQSFACHATRRLDRWNMNIVMLSSFHLLHLYFQEYGAIDASPAPLVVACIYLSGKSEYLFVKADKLRQVANKYVRDLNDPIMDSNLQVYKYEAQLLRMLQYNVGSIPNPLRILKALDIIEANSHSPPGVPASLDPIIPSNATTSSNSMSSAAHECTATATTTVDTLNVAITATLGTTTDAASSTAASTVTSPPPVVVSLKNTGLSQARRLIDEAAAVFVKEEYLFNLDTHDLILSEQDFFLASATLLEKTHVAFSTVDFQECERKCSKFLHQLNELSPSLRQNQVLTAVASGYNARSNTASAPSFMSLLLSLRLPKEPKPPADLSQMEEGEVLTSDTNSPDPLVDSSSSSALSESTVRHGTALFSVSAGCIELINRVLPRVEREIYEASAMKARAGTAVPAVPPMPIAPVLAGPVQTLLSRQTAPAYPVHPSRAGLIASGQTSSSAGINGGARDTYSASQDNRGEKRSRGRSRSPPREDNKKRRWDTYAEPDRDAARHSQIDNRSDHRGDSRESRDQSDRPRRDREDSRERRRRAEIEAQAVEDAFLMDYDSNKRSRKEQSLHNDLSRSRGHGQQRTPPDDRYRDAHQNRDHRRREDSRDRARHRPRSPLVPPPPPRIPPPPPIPAPPSIPDVPRTMPGSSQKRPRSNSRSPGRHRNYAPLPPYPSVQPLPPPRSSYGSREEYQESSRSSRDNKKVSLSAPLSHTRSVHTSKRTVELEDGEEGELMEDGEVNSVDADNSNYCQFIGTSTGNNTGASSAQVSSAPTPFLASAPSAPRVGLTQSMSQSWMPNDEEEENEVVFLSPPAPVVDLTSGSPFVNTSSILPMPNIAKLTQFLAGRSAAGNSVTVTAAAAMNVNPTAGTSQDKLPRAPPVLVVPPVLTIPAVPNQTAPELPAPVSVPIIPLVPAGPASSTAVSAPELVNAAPALVESMTAPAVDVETTSCTSTESTAHNSNTSTAAAEAEQTGEGSIASSTSVHFNPSPSISVSATSIEGDVSSVNPMKMKPEVAPTFVGGVVQDISAVPAEAVGEEGNEDGEIVETTAAKTLPATINTAARAISASIITPVSLTTTNSSALTTESKSRIVTIPKMIPKWQREQQLQESATTTSIDVRNAKDGSKEKNDGNKSAQNKGSANNNTGGAKDNRDPGNSKHGKNSNIDNSDRNKHDRGANRNDNSAFTSASSRQSNKHHSNDTGNRNVSPSNQIRDIKRTASSEHKNTANLAPNDARHIILHSQAAHASRAGSDTTNTHRGSSNPHIHRGSSNAHNHKGNRTNGTGTDTGSSTSSSSGSNGRNSHPEDKKAKTFGFIRSILANPEGSRIRK